MSFLSVFRGYQKVIELGPGWGGSLKRKESYRVVVQLSYAWRMGMRPSPNYFKPELICVELCYCCFGIYPEKITCRTCILENQLNMGWLPKSPRSKPMLEAGISDFSFIRSTHVGLSSYVGPTYPGIIFDWM